MFIYKTRIERKLPFISGFVARCAVACVVNEWVSIRHQSEDELGFITANQIGQEQLDELKKRKYPTELIMKTARVYEK